MENEQYFNAKLELIKSLIERLEYNIDYFIDRVEDADYLSTDEKKSLFDKLEKVQGKK